LTLQRNVDKKGVAGNIYHSFWIVQLVCCSLLQGNLSKTLTTSEFSIRKEMSLQVKVHEEEAALEAIKQVRNDKSETNWVLFGHLNDDPNTISLEATGSDGYGGLISRINDSKFQYGLLRVTTKVDLAITVKFVYIHWQGEKVGFAKRGRFSVVHGEVLIILV
jgi:Cofilin/tropomyosin-type actin-binding protein